MISTADSKLRIALGILKKNPNIAPAIKELETAPITVILRQSSSAPNSSTEVMDTAYTIYHVVINSKADDAIASQKWGISGTSEVNSLAHEIGHVYWIYLRQIKKKPNMLDGKPATVTADQWDNMLSEVAARRYDSYTRPAGTFIPVYDPRAETVVERLDFTPFPFSLMK